MVCRRVLEMFDAAGVLRSNPADREIEINWPSPLPESDSDQLDIAQRKLNLGVPQSIVLAELGYSNLPAFAARRRPPPDPQSSCRLISFTLITRRPP